MSSQIFSMFSAILLVLGYLERLSSSTDTQPALKRECHSKTTVQFKECSPKASQSISRVLVAHLPSFTRNLMQIRCPSLSSIADKIEHEVEIALI
jgi:hypothetical protein